MSPEDVMNQLLSGDCEPLDVSADATIEAWVRSADGRTLLEFAHREPEMRARQPTPIATHKAL